MGELHQLCDRLDHSEEIRLWDHQHRGVPFRQQTPGRVEVRAAVLGRGQAELGPPARGVGLQHRKDLGMEGGGGDNAGPSGVGARQQGPLSGGGGDVVHRGIGHRQVVQLGHHRLEFEDRLQVPLARFRLVGGVSGVELRAADRGPHHRRDEPGVDPRSEEAVPLRKWPVAPRQPLHLLHQLQLAERRGKLHGGVLQVRRDLPEELRRVIEAERGQHLLPVRV